MSTTQERLTDKEYEWLQDAWETWMRRYVGSSYQTIEVERREGGRVLFWRKEYGPRGNVSLDLLWEAERLPRDSIRRQAAIAAAACLHKEVQEIDPELSDDRLDQLTREQDFARQAAPEGDWRTPKDRSLKEELGLRDDELRVLPADKLPEVKDGPIELRSGGGEESDRAPADKGGGTPRRGKGGKSTGD